MILLMILNETTEVLEENLLWKFFKDFILLQIVVLLHYHFSLPICIGSASDTNTINLAATDRKSTRLNSSHQIISYGAFCLKKKNKPQGPERPDKPHRSPAPSGTLPHSP